MLDANQESLTFFFLIIITIITSLTALLITMQTIPNQPKNLSSYIYIPSIYIEREIYIYIYIYICVSK